MLSKHVPSSISHLQDTVIDNVFFLEKSCTKMYAIFSAVQRQQRKSDVMTYFGLAACSAVYYHVFLIECKDSWYLGFVAYSLRLSQQSENVGVNDWINNECRAIFCVHNLMPQAGF
jgi:hypothetical protein